MCWRGVPEHLGAAFRMSPDPSEDLLSSIVSEAFLGRRARVLREIWRTKWKKLFRAKARERRNADKLADKLLSRGPAEILDVDEDVPGIQEIQEKRGRDDGDVPAELNFG